MHVKLSQTCTSIGAMAAAVLLVPALDCHCQQPSHAACMHLHVHTHHMTCMTGMEQTVSKDDSAVFVDPRSLFWYTSTAQTRHHLCLQATVKAAASCVTEVSGGGRANGCAYSESTAYAFEVAAAAAHAEATAHAFASCSCDNAAAWTFGDAAVVKTLIADVYAAAAAAVCATGTLRGRVREPLAATGRDRALGSACSCIWRFCPAASVLRCTAVAMIKQCCSYGLVLVLAVFFGGRLELTWPGCSFLARQTMHGRHACR